jgi:small subunit ribosomal protein S13
MAEDKKIQKNENVEKKPEVSKRPGLISKEDTARIIRILQTDVPGNKNVYSGLTRIKGVSWAISNALCIKLNLDKTRKIESLSKDEIAKIEEGLKTADFPVYILNRRNDLATGTNSHLLGNALELAKELDIKRLKKIRSFRGLRHAMGQPTRGQSTKAHFRSNRKKGVGLKPKKAGGTA